MNKETGMTVRLITILLITVARSPVITAQNLDNASPETFKFGLNFYASSTGYYEVEGYEGVAPELVMEVGKTYTFDQTNDTNWMHPLGFAYYPDGAHEGVDEVETDSLVYLIDGEQPAENLDGYEPEFFMPKDMWMEKKYTVQLTITPEILAKAQGGIIFYFCHIHGGMSGIIRLVDPDGNPAETKGTPPALPPLYQPDEFDAACGTYEASPFAAGATPDKCPGQTFLCSEMESEFGKCMHAIDCKMNYEMRVKTNVETSYTATFMHQMIPHHENAVNMAKILAKFGSDVDEETMAMLYEIINTQNAQITYMNGWLKENGFGAHQDVICEDAETATADKRSIPQSMEPEATEAESATSHASAHLFGSPVLMLLATAALAGLF